MSQLFVGISTRSTDPSKITPLIVCTLSSISYEIKGKISFFCFVILRLISSMSSRGEAVAIQIRFEVYLDCEATALRTLFYSTRHDSQRCRIATEGVEY